jgi:hypothetical protein
MTDLSRDAISKNTGIPPLSKESVQKETLDAIDKFSMIVKTDLQDKLKKYSNQTQNKEFLKIKIRLDYYPRQKKWGFLDASESDKAYHELVKACKKLVLIKPDWPEFVTSVNYQNTHDKILSHLCSDILSDLTKYLETLGYKCDNRIQSRVHTYRNYPDIFYLDEYVGFLFELI